MARRGDERNLEWVWKIDWRRNLFDCEMTQEQELMSLLEGKRVNAEKKDT